MRLLFLLLPVLLALIMIAQPGLAAAPANYNVQWSSLQPGTDWAAQIINDLFPVLSNTGLTAAPPQNESTVIGEIVGEMTGFVAAITMVFVCYSSLMHVYRGAETSRLLGSNQTGITVLRIGFAVVMMFPLPSGFSSGQALVVQTAMWGTGMANVVYKKAVQAIGPDGRVIAQPIIPGTKAIVAGLIENELCKSLVNLASGNPKLVPEPKITTWNPTTSVAGVGGELGGYVTYAYNLSAGNGWGSPACGTVTVRTTGSAATNILGVSVDKTSLQQTALEQVLRNDIVTQVGQVAQQFWQTKHSSSLAPLMTVMVAAVQDYQARLLDEATKVRRSLQTAFTKAAGSPVALDTFTQGVANQYQLSNLGWEGAGAYYLEFARLNGATLSLLSAAPDVNPPSYQGLGTAISSDLAPLIQSSSAFMANLQSYISTQDGSSTPGGNADLFSGAMPGSNGASGLDQVARSLHLSDYILQLFTSLIEPSAGYWVDPFGNLMGVGNTMIMAALTAMGTAGLLSSTTGTVGMAAFSLLSGNPIAAASTLVVHNMITFLATPIMTGCMALLIPGLIISYVLPSIPYIIWIAGVIGWLILVCEAVVAVPLWMLAHMTTSGEGLHGKAQEGYALLFNVLFRPVFMLIGLFLGYFIFSAMCWLIHQTFGVMAGFILSNGWLVTNLIGVIVLLMIFVVLHMTAALLSFRLVSMLPEQLPRIIGFSSGDRVDMHQFAKDATAIGAANVVGLLARPPPPPPPPGAESPPGPPPPPGGGMLSGPN